MWCGSGCAERVIESRTSIKAVIFGLGVEKKDDTYIAHAQNVKYTPTDGKRAYDYELIKVEAPNVYELVNKLSVLNEKTTLWKHLQMFIIHETFDLDSFLSFSDYLERSPEIPIDFAVVYTNEKLEEIMNITNGSDIIPAMTTYTMLLEERPTVAAVPVRFVDISRNFQEEFQDLSIPMIYIKNGSVMIGGTAIYIKNGNVTFLTSDETKSLLRIKGKFHPIIEPIITGEPSSSEISCATNVKTSKVNLKATLENDQPIIHVHVKDTYNLEILSPHKRLTEKDLQEINVTYQDQLRHRLESMIAHLQQMPANILGFAQLIERQQPTYWKTHQHEWDTLYPKLIVRVTVESKSQHVGLIRSFDKSNGKE